MNTHNNTLPFVVRRISPENSNIFGEDGVVSSVDKCGFFLCESGYVKLRKDEESFEIKAGMVYIYFPSTYVKLLEISNDVSGYLVDARRDYILPMGGEIISIADLITVRQLPMFEIDEVAARIFSKHIEDLMETIDRMDERGLKNNRIKMEFFKSIGRALFFELMCYYFESERLTTFKPSKKELVLQRFILSLSRNFDTHREVSFYAEEQNIAPRYFSTIIKQTSGRKALDWITQTVISDAKQKLIRNELSIKEIAVSLNFLSQTFFGKYFKQYTGMSPKEFREQNKY